MKRRQEEPDHSPSAPDVERTVLGVILLKDSSFYEMIAYGLTVECFSLDSNRRIFRTMERLAALKKQSDLVTVCDELENQKELRTVGGPGYVASLVDGVSDYGSIKQHVDILREKCLRRQLIKLAVSAQNSAIDLSDPIKFTTAGLLDDLLRLQGDVTRDGYSIHEFDQEALAEIKEQMQSAQEIVGLPFGIRELDEITTGMRAGDFIPVGGYPGSAKTAFACNVARINAQRGTPVGFFSIEMMKDQLLHRFWAQASDISYSKLRNPKNLHRQELLELEQKWMPEVRQWPIKIDDSAKDIQEIIPRAHLWVRRYGVKLIIVDFLQRVHAPGKGEYEIVSYAADALTEFAKTTRVPVLCLSQLTRAEDKRNAANTVPNMQMLRSSGRIEQNAHLVLFTHRPEDDRGDPTGEDMIIVGKQRAGVRGRIKAYFHGSSQRWEERSGTTATPQMFDKK
jgi:replicative DNA helicase